MVKNIIKAILSKDRIITENSDEAKQLYEQSRFGFLLGNGRVQLSLLEGLYLLEAEKIGLLHENGRKVEFEKFIKKASKFEPKLLIKFAVYKDMRNRGYIIKTALKFGADFRVYERGVKPGEDHAKWVVYPVHEGEVLTWHEWAAKNRVAHSTRKRLLIGVVDDENDVSYWEARWVRP